MTAIYNGGEQWELMFDDKNITLSSKEVEEIQCLDLGIHRISENPYVRIEELENKIFDIEEKIYDLVLEINSNDVINFEYLVQKLKQIV